MVVRSTLVLQHVGLEHHKIKINIFTPHNFGATHNPSNQVGGGGAKLEQDRSLEHLINLELGIIILKN